MIYPVLAHIAGVPVEETLLSVGPALVAAVSVGLVRIRSLRDRTPVDGAGSPLIEAGSPVTKAGSPVIEAGSPVIEAGSPVIEAGSPVIEAGSPLTAVEPPLVAGAGARADAGEGGGA